MLSTLTIYSSTLSTLPSEYGTFIENHSAPLTPRLTDKPRCLFYNCHVTMPITRSTTDFRSDGPVETFGMETIPFKVNSHFRVEEYVLILL